MFLVSSVWMVAEAQRLDMKHSWAYVVFGLIIAIGVTFPLFLFFRERKLAEGEKPSPTE